MVTKIELLKNPECHQVKKKRAYFHVGYVKTKNAYLHAYLLLIFYQRQFKLQLV